MKVIFTNFIYIVHILSLCGVIFSGILGAIYDIIGPAKFECMLSKIGIPNGYDRLWVVSAIMLLLLIITYFIKARLLAN